MIEYGVHEIKVKAKASLKTYASKIKRLFGREATTSGENKVVALAEMKLGINKEKEENNVNCQYAVAESDSRKRSADDLGGYGLPIIFIHYNNSDYLKYTLRQAKISNPNSQIYFLGDEKNDCYGFVEHHHFSNYFEKAKEFGHIYRHLSTNNLYYERLNFQRWFTLGEFIKTHRIPKCLYVDSDTMLYADVTEEAKKFAEYDFTLSAMRCGQTFFLNRVEALDNFCQFLMEIYSKKDRYNYDKILVHFAVNKKNRRKEGVSDMTAFNLFLHNKHYAEIGEVSKVINGSIFDININTPTPSFEMEKTFKKVYWQNGAPYGKYLRTGEMVKFNSLHFQGKAKKIIGQYFRDKIQTQETDTSDNMEHVAREIRTNNFL